MEKKFKISEANKLILGICGGVAEYLKLDATLVRMVALFLALSNPIGAGITYLVAYLMLNKK